MGAKRSLRGIAPLAMRDNLKRVVRQRPLQCRRFRPRRPHPGIHLPGRRPDDRHCLRADLRDDGARFTRQDRRELPFALDRIGRRAAAARPGAPHAGQGKQRLPLPEGEGLPGPVRTSATGPSATGSVSARAGRTVRPDDAVGERRTAGHQEPHGDRRHMPPARRQPPEDHLPRPRLVQTERPRTDLARLRLDLLRVDPMAGLGDRLPDGKVVEMEGWLWRYA
ncbi:hypothetical protein AB7M35_004262 [Amorphus suaedae]